MRKNSSLANEIESFLKKENISMAAFERMAGVKKDTVRNILRKGTTPNGETYVAIRKILKNDLIDPLRSDDVILSAIATLLVVLQREGVMRPDALREAFNEIHDSYDKEGNKNGQHVTADLLECIDGAKQERISQRILRLVPPKPPIPPTNIPK